MMRNRIAAWLVLATFVLASPAFSATGDEEDRIAALEAKVDLLVEELTRLKTEREADNAIDSNVTLAPNPEMQEQIGVLAREVERVKRAVAVPEEKELKSVYGFGPAASKVYLKERGLSIGGYGEGFFKAITKNKYDRDNTADWLRGVLYFGYKFSDRIIFNSEIEFEHAATSKNGSASVEFAQIDFLLHEDEIGAVNATAGLLLTPMGFLNLLHEPTYFYGVSRPSPEKQIIPSTWREIGAGFFGNLFNDTVSYKVYTQAGLDAAGFKSSGFRSARQKGSKSKANDWAFVARVDWLPVDGLLVGGSVWTGASGQNQTLTNKAGTKYALDDIWTTIWELHAQYDWKGLHTRALFTMSHVGNAKQLSNATDRSIASRSVGGYAEVAYDILPLFLPDTTMRLEPFYRFEWTETQNKLPDGIQANQYDNFRVNMVGLQFYPHPQVVLKLDYRNVYALGRNADGEQRPDEIQVGLGYVF